MPQFSLQGQLLRAEVAFLFTIPPLQRRTDRHELHNWMALSRINHIYLFVSLLSDKDFVVFRCLLYYTFLDPCEACGVFVTGVEIRQFLFCCGQLLLIELVSMRCVNIIISTIRDCPLLDFSGLLYGEEGFAIISSHGRWVGDRSLSLEDK